MKIVCFHNSDDENGYLSNWCPSLFTVDGVAAKILNTDDVACIKELGRLVSNYDDSHWNGIRQLVVYEVFLAKFSKNENLKK